MQVVKEERGTKGAALTTYLSLAGRYSVLMPNTARGGGISRKITKSRRSRAAQGDRRRISKCRKAWASSCAPPAPARTKTEIKRDFEYLLRIWETVRDLTLKSTAPKLVYEEGSLVKRSIRDLYSKDIDEVVVAGGGRLSGGQRIHAHAHAEPCQEREALYRHAAAVVALRRREPARRHVLAGRAAAIGRLHRAQPGRGAGRDRRQFRPRDARAPYRGHRAQNQSRSGRRDRAAASACATSPG